MLLKRNKKDGNKNNISSRKYGQVKLRHAKRGISSCLFAIGAFVAQCILLLVAYFTYGAAPTVVGSLGMIALMFSCVGIVSAFRGFREREKNYLTCKIGLITNTFIILLYTVLFIRGLL